MQDMWHISQNPRHVTYLPKSKICKISPMLQRVAEGWCDQCVLRKIPKNSIILFFSGLSFKLNSIAMKISFATLCCVPNYAFCNCHNNWVIAGKIFMGNKAEIVDICFIIRENQWLQFYDAILVVGVKKKWIKKCCFTFICSETYHF